MGRSETQGRVWLCSEFETSLTVSRPCLKKTKTTKSLNFPGRMDKLTSKKEKKTTYLSATKGAFSVKEHPTHSRLAA